MHEHKLEREEVMKRRYAVFISIGIIIILLLCTCTYFFRNSNPIKVKVWINELEKEDFNEFIFYETLGDIGGKCVVVNANKKDAILDEKVEVKSTCYNVYDCKMFDRIEKYSDLNREDILDYGQVFLYDKNEKYEVMLLNGYSNRYWKVIIFNRVDLKVESIELDKTEYGSCDMLSSMQLDNDLLYLYAKDEKNIWISKINMSQNLTDEKYMVPCKKVGFVERQLKYTYIFVDQNYVYLWDGEKGVHDSVKEYERDKGKSVLLRYDLNNNELISNEMQGLLWRLVKTDTGIVGLHSEFDKLFMDYFTDDLELQNSIDLDLTMNNKITPEMGVTDEYFYRCGNLLCGTISDRKKRSTSYTVIIDIKKAKIVYCAAVSGVKMEYGKIFNWYCSKDGEELYNLY